MKSMIPSLPRATANLMLQSEQEVMNKDGIRICSEAKEVREVRERVAGSPARADIDVVDFPGHPG